jgi:hypothetical protein
MRMMCPACEGELEFEIEGPEYDVGLTGYTAILQDADNPAKSWQCNCIRTQDEIEQLEYEVAVEYAMNPPETPGLT